MAEASAFISIFVDPLVKLNPSDDEEAEEPEDELPELEDPLSELPQAARLSPITITAAAKIPFMFLICSFLLITDDLSIFFQFLILGFFHILIELYFFFIDLLILRILPVVCQVIGFY